MAIRFDPKNASDHLLAHRRVPIPRPLLFALAALVFFTAVYHVSGGVFGVPEALRHRVTHITLFLILTYLFFPLGRRSWREPLNRLFLVDLVLIVLALVAYVYVMNDIRGLAGRAAFPETRDVVVGTVMILLVLEAVRRTVGLPLVIIPGFFILHALYANSFPGVFYTAPAEFDYLVGYLAFNLDGMLGIPISVASTFIIVFMLFGAVLVRSGAGQFFTDLAYAATGWMAGGPAKAATVASGLYGSLSGSTTANVVTSGSFTIPLMRSSGFRPQFAASAEAIASNGGQMMPPIMGAAAFIIPMYIPGASYRDVVIAAVIPAILYFVSLFAMVHFEAKKCGLQGLPRSRLPRVAAVLRVGWPLMFSLFTIIGLLLYGFTPMVAGVAALLVTILVTCFRPETRMSPRDLIAAMETGVRSTIPIVMACAAAGLIIGSMNVSGLAGRISGAVVDLAGGQLWLGLLATMVVCVILGMGMTTTIIYLTLAALVVPSVIEMGAHIMAANLFVFYFGALSGVTPPVALTTYAAAGIAGSDPWRTGWEAAKVGLASFIIPFMFVYTPELLMIGTPPAIMVAAFTALCGVLMLAAAVQGYFVGRLTLWERFLMAAGAVLLVHPSAAGALLAFVLVAAASLRNVRTLRHGRSGGQPGY